MSRGYGFKNISSATIKGVYYIIPFAVTGGVLISLAYITDMIFLPPQFTVWAAKILLR